MRSIKSQKIIKKMQLHSYPRTDPYVCRFLIELSASNIYPVKYCIGIEFDLMLARVQLKYD